MGGVERWASKDDPGKKQAAFRTEWVGCKSEDCPAKKEHHGGSNDRLYHSCVESGHLFWAYPMRVTQATALDKIHFPVLFALKICSFVKPAQGALRDLNSLNWYKRWFTISYHYIVETYVHNLLRRMTAFKGNNDSMMV